MNSRNLHIVALAVIGSLWQFLIFIPQFLLDFRTGMLATYLKGS